MKLVIDIPDYDVELIKEYYKGHDIVESIYSYIYHGQPLSEVIEGILGKIAGVPYHFWDSEAVVYLDDVISAIEDCEKGGE